MYYNIYWIILASKCMSDFYQIPGLYAEIPDFTPKYLFLHQNICFLRQYVSFWIPLCW